MSSLAGLSSPEQANNAMNMMGGNSMNVGVMDPLSFGKKKDDTKLPHLGSRQGSFGKQRMGSR